MVQILPVVSRLFLFIYAILLYICKNKINLRTLGGTGSICRMKAYMWRGEGINAPIDILNNS